MDTQIPHSAASQVTANGIEIVYDTFGDPSAPPLLLIMGLGAQMIAWDDEFCTELAAQGYWVIRYDNRDVGLSTRLEGAGVPNIPALVQAVMEGEAVNAPYTLRDMAEDAIGLFDALGIARAHIVGLSMGGMIVQELAIHFADRVQSITSIMSSAGDLAQYPPTAEALTVLLEPAPTDRLPYIESSVEASRVFSGPAWPIDEGRVRARAGQAYDRGLSPAGTARQMAAILASGSRSEALKTVAVPALVIHGEADPLVPVAGGVDTARAIPGADLLVIEGMGHDLPPALWPRVIEKIASFAI